MRHWNAVRAMNPLRNTAKTHSPPPHHFHLFDDCLLLGVGDKFLAFNWEPKPSETTKELAFGFLDLLHLTNPSSDPLTLKSCESWKDREDHWTNSIVSDVTAKINEMNWHASFFKFVKGVEGISRIAEGAVKFGEDQYVPLL